MYNSALGTWDYEHYMTVCKQCLLKRKLVFISGTEIFIDLLYDNGLCYWYSILQFVSSAYTDIKRFYIPNIWPAKLIFPPDCMIALSYGPDCTARSKCKFAIQNKS